MISFASVISWFPSWLLHLTSVTTLAYAAYYLLFVCEKPRLYYKATARNQFLIEKCTLLRQRFCPTPWGFNTHPQTVINVLFRKNMVIKYEREYITLYDGGTVNVDWVIMDKAPVMINTKNAAAAEKLAGRVMKEMSQLPSDSTHTPRKTPVVLVLPGVTGSSEALEIKLFVECCRRNGIRCVVFNYRGAEQKITSSRIGVVSADLAPVVEHVASKLDKDTPFLAVGFSMGANVLCKYLAEHAMAQKGKCPIKAAIAVSNPFCLKTATQMLKNKVANVLYDKYFTEKRKKQILSHPEIFSKVDGIDLAEVAKVVTTRDFDTAVSIKILGLDNADIIYEENSSLNYMDKINIPLLTINALDDPISCGAIIPVQTLQANPNIIAVTTKRGGHVAFVDNVLPFSDFRGGPKFTWMERACIQFIEAVCEYNDEVPQQEHDKMETEHHSHEHQQQRQDEKKQQ